MIKKIKEPIIITKPVMVDLDDLYKKLKEVWDSGWLTNNGYKHQELEKKLQEDIFNSLPTSLVVNATIGLLVALKALNIKGDVITTPFTFPATAHAITWMGLNPIFCDIDRETMNIDADKIEKLITPKTSAILAVHVFGNPCDVERIEKIAKKHNLKVIYDAAHAFELEINGKNIANYGDASVFSFHATKLFHTAEGGAIVFKDLAIKEKCDVIKNFGIKDEEIIECGINGKMNELQASVGLLMLKEKENERIKRMEIEKVYQEELKDLKGIVLSKKPDYINKNSFQYFAIRIYENKFGVSRDVVLEKLKELNIHARKYFYPLCTEYPHYNEFGSRASLPVSYDVIDEVLCLPFHGGITVDEALFVCRAIKSFKK